MDGPHLVYPFICPWTLGAFHLTSTLINAATSMVNTCLFESLPTLNTNPLPLPPALGNYLSIFCFFNFDDFRYFL